MNTNTIATALITDTTAVIKRNKSVEYFSSDSPKGLSNSYSVLGLIVSIETLRKRGYTSYETYLKVAYKGHWGAPDTFTDWFKNYRAQYNLRNNNTFIINREFVERHTATRLQEAHDIGVIAGELHVLTVINKYIELLFTDVDKEVITRQINELQSQLSTLA